MRARTRGLLYPYRLNMSETISISVSAAAIFCSDEGCGRPPNREKDILDDLRRGLRRRERRALRGVWSLEREQVGRRATAPSGPAM